VYLKHKKYLYQVLSDDKEMSYDVEVRVGS